jgi:hypothetical protein
MEDSLRQDGRERVGGFTMIVEVAEPSPEGAERWAQRAEMLAQWLAAEWQHERQEVCDE